jgi:hypothetical protein
MDASLAIAVALFVGVWTTLAQIPIAGGSSAVPWLLQSLFWLNMSNAGNAKLKSVSRLIGRMKTLHVKAQQGEDAEIVPKYSKICFPTTRTLCWSFILTLTLKSSFQNPESRYATFFSSFGYKDVVR